MHRHRIVRPFSVSRAAVGALAVVAAFAVPASSAQAAIGIEVESSIPASVTVEQNVPGALTITNVSQNVSEGSTFESDSLRLDNITLVASCGSRSGSEDCPSDSLEPGVLVPEEAGLGRAETVCAGQPFSIALIDAAQGKYRFTPDSPVVLGPSNGVLAERRCIIDFTYHVEKPPSRDSSSTPGTQTDQIAFAFATDITSGANFGQTTSAVGRSQTAIRVTPTIATQASPTMKLGQGGLTDTATVSGLVNPVTGSGAGTVTFELYGVNDDTCGSPIFTSSGRPLTLNGAATVGTAQSDGEEPRAAGTYRWIASYSGDANNAPVSGACNDPDEQTVVTRATPAIATQASPAIVVGAGTLTDTVRVTELSYPGLFGAGGIVTFSLYGPDDATCSTAIFTSRKSLIHDRPGETHGYAQSDGFAPTTAGTYRWIASYSGDANNEPVAGACNDVNEQTVVSPARPSLTAEASVTVTAGQAVSSVGRLAGGSNPTGSLTFRLYGPGDPNCSGTPATTVVKTISGIGEYGSGDFVTTVAGDYRWVVSYGGDASNAAVTTACGEANVAVTAPPAGTPTPTLTPAPVPVPVPVVITPVSPAGLTLKATPRRDRRLPYSYRFSGKLGLPAGVTAAQGCSGEVTVRVKNGRKTISTRTVQLTSGCTYASKVKFTQKHRLRRRGGKLKVLVRFLGNTRLAKISAGTRSVLYG